MQLSRLCLIFICLSTVFIGSCGKDKSPFAGLLKTVSVTRIQYGQTANAVDTYIYDYRGRLVEDRSYSSPQNNSRIKYTYTADTVRWDWYWPDTSNAGYQNISFYLNSIGQAIHNDAGDTYTYNANGNETMQYIVNDDSIVYTVVNGNAIVIRQTNGPITDSLTFTNFTETRNKGMAYLGKLNANLPDVDHGREGSHPFVINYSYSFDSQNRVSRETQVAQGANTNYNFTLTTDYTYY